MQWHGDPMCAAVALIQWHGDPMCAAAALIQFRSKILVNKLFTEFLLSTHVLFSIAVSY